MQGDTAGSAAPQQKGPDALPVEERVDLQRALLRISRADRRLLWQAYVERQRGSEIAAGLGVAPDAVRRRLARAAKRLRDAMGPGYGGSR
jgi:DNA-directed RNA polymerase specialized sigma24 family protein